MDIEKTLLGNEGTSLLVVHEIIGFSIQGSNISITICPQNETSQKKTFVFSQAEYKSLIVHEHCDESAEMPWTILGVVSRELDDSRYEFVFGCEDTELKFHAKWPENR